MIRKFPFNLNVQLVVGFLIISGVFYAIHGDEKAKKLFRKGKYQEVINHINSSIPPNSRNSDVWAMLAYSNEMTGLTEKAMAGYMFSLRTDPKHYASLLGMGRVYNKLKNYNSALTKIKAAIDIRFSAAAAHEYAVSCFALKRDTEAKNILVRAYGLEPNNAQIIEDLGELYFKEKNYKKAIDFLRPAFKKQRSAKLAYQLGKAYLNVNDYGNAIKFIETALKKNNRLFEANLVLAQLYFKEGKFKAAASEYEKVSFRLDFKAKDHYQFAVASEKSKKPQAAIREYGEAVKKYRRSKSTEALMSRLKVGKADFAAKKFKTAQIHFEFIYKADSKGKVVPDIHLLLDDVYRPQNKLTSAITVLKAAVKGNPSNTEAYERLAALYKLKKQPLNVIKTYEKLLKLKPNEPKYYLPVADHYVKQKKYNEALNLYTQSSQLKPSANASKGITLMAHKLKKYGIAKRAAEKCLKLDRDMHSIRKILYQMYLNDKNYKDAAKHIEVLVKKFPRKLSYWELLAKCYGQLKDESKLAEADQNIVKLSAKNTTSRHRLAEYKIEKKDFKSAYSLYKQLSALQPKRSSNFKKLYDISKELKYKKSALIYIKKYVALRPTHAEAQMNLGDAYYEVNQKTNAFAAYKKAARSKKPLKGFYKRYSELVIAKGTSSQQKIAVLAKAVEYDEADIKIFIKLASLYQDKKWYKSAVKIYGKALAVDSKNANVLSNMARCQVKAGQKKEATITYEQLIMLKPTVVAEYKELGDIYIAQGKKEPAVNAYKKYLKRNKAGVDSKIARIIGSFEYGKENYPEAVKYLRKVKGKSAESFTHKFQYGTACYHTKNHKTAIAVLEGLRKRNPKASTLKKILKMLGEMYEAKNHKTSAAKVYAAYIRIKGVRDPDIAYKVGFLQERSKPTNAKNAYSANTKKYPKDYRNFHRLGLLYCKKKATRLKGITNLKLAVALTDTVPTIWLEIARNYGKSGKKYRSKQIAAYKKYLEKEPNNVEANKTIGAILIGQGKTSEGVIYLEMANTVAPKDIDVINSLIVAYEKTDRLQAAIQLLKKAKSIKKNDPKILYQLANLYRKTGQLSNAASEIKKLINTQRTNKNLMLYAEINIELRQFKPAEEAIADIRTSDPANKEVLMLLAKIYRKQGKNDDAIAIYKEISEIDNGYVPAVFERAEVLFANQKYMWSELFYKRTLEKDSRNALAHLGLAKIARVRNKKSLYFDHLRQARKLDAKNPAIQAEIEKSRNY